MFFNLKEDDLDISVEILRNICMDYNHHFRNKTRSAEERARQYLQGIFLGIGRGNMCSYARDVPDCNNQSLQHFISNSPWNERDVIDHIQRDASRLIGSCRDGSIHIDESCFPKQGDSSVGVKRQYCGSRGKVENCQTGVFLSICSGAFRTIINGRIYLPEDWADDPDRRAKCGVPDDVIFKSKAQIALEMVLHARDNGVLFAWIGMDSFYGEHTWLLNRLEEKGLTYIANIHSNSRCWLRRPLTGVPERRSRRGRHPTKTKVLDGESPPIEVSEICRLLEPHQWRKVMIRDTERKELVSDMAFLRVYPVNDGLPGKEAWLIIRKDEGETKVKYQLSNAPENTSIEMLAKMSCSRYWIERSFEDAKGLAGLADSETRSWDGWHRHVTMSMLAMLVILMISIRLGDKADMITVQNIKKILDVMLPRRFIGKKEILEMMEAEHKARSSSKISHHRRYRQLQSPGDG
jgi:SRSO17 transposase